MDARSLPAFLLMTRYCDRFLIFLCQIVSRHLVSIPRGPVATLGWKRGTHGHKHNYTHPLRR
jgi:hypothetical protein